MNKLLIAYIGILLLALVTLFSAMLMFIQDGLQNKMMGGVCIILNFFYVTEWIKYIYEEAFKETN